MVITLQAKPASLSATSLAVNGGRKLYYFKYEKSGYLDNKTHNSGKYKYNLS